MVYDQKFGRTLRCPATIGSELANFQQRFTSSMKLVPQKKRAILHWSAWSEHSRISACISFLLLIAASCSRNDAASVLNPVKVADVIVGQSSRADVFAALGRPTRTEQTAWGSPGFMKTRAMPQAGDAFSGGGCRVRRHRCVRALCWFRGLRLGARWRRHGRNSETDVASLAVEFGANGVVRECVYSSSALPAGVPGAVAVAPIDCQRPAAKGHR